MTIEIIKLIVLIVGAVWGFYRFKAEGQYKPRVEFDVEVNFLQHHDNSVAAEFIIVAENKGIRTRSFDQIYLSVKGIKSNSELGEWEKDKPRLLFPIKIIDKAELVYKKKFKSIFVEPGVKQKITYFSKVPSDISLISVRAEFLYNNNKSHSTERMYRVMYT